MKRKLKHDMQAAITARIFELKEKPFPELKALPSLSDVPCQSEGINFTVTTWTKLETTGKLQVGVYAYYVGKFNIGTSFNDGFFINSEGSIEEMPVEIQLKRI